MQEMYTEDLGKILRSKNLLEEKLKVKIKNTGKLLFINGDSENEYTASIVIDAINLGFSVERALFLTQEENILEIINIKDYTRRKNLELIRARIIGTHGKTLKTMQTLTDCAFAIKDNKVGIIGNYEDVKEASQAVKMIIQGSKQANVYAKLEKDHKEKRIKTMMNIKDKFKKNLQKELDKENKDSDCSDIEEE
ncbi:MAG: KH domain-containing protein [Candidatus Nanoarchaeia archaeon]